MYPDQIRGKYVHVLVHKHNWNRLQNSDRGDWWVEFNCLKAHVNRVHGTDRFLRIRLLLQFNLHLFETAHEFKFNFYFAKLS